MGDSLPAVRKEQHRELARLGQECSCLRAEPRERELRPNGWRTDSVTWVLSEPVAVFEAVKQPRFFLNCRKIL